jgi:guanyl-specific ribonuclease Sa
MSSRRISYGLIGLLVLVLVGWFVKDLAGGSTPAAPSATSSAPAASSRSAPATATATATVPGAASGLAVQPLSALPPEAAGTWALIRKGGPYPYPRNDGVVFRNAEKLLPRKADGYYHEFTVRTPGSPDRGARRLITGSERELYYTADHYDSFVVVDPER